MTIDDYCRSFEQSMALLNRPEKEIRDFMIISKLDKIIELLEESARRRLNGSLEAERD